MSNMSNIIHNWLTKTNNFFFSFYAIAASFCTYACMYAYRKPFSVASFENGPILLGLDTKSAFVISQAIGYTCSKFIGIKIVSEMEKKNRALAIVLLILIAQIALLFFAAAPNNYKILFIFLNGLPLGMIWGLVFSFLEGRKITELLGAGLCASFIFSSGFVKTIGMILIIEYGVSEYWMPFTIGLVFIIPLVFFVYLLSNIPTPTPEDELLRTRREPMNREQRFNFFMTFAPGLILLTTVYTFLTAYRDLRDNYMAEILDSLGYGDTPYLFTTTELPIAFLVLILLAFMVVIKDNKKALLINHFIILTGSLLVGFSTYLFQLNLLHPITWIISTGLGTYMAYIPFNCILFERLIATFKYLSTSTFLIYIADAFGYLGSVGTLLYKNYSYSGISWLSFFIQLSYGLAIFSVLFIIVSAIYFHYKAGGISIKPVLFAEKINT